MGDVNREGGVARPVPLPDGTYKRPDVVAKVVEAPAKRGPKVNTDVQTKSVGKE